MKCPGAFIDADTATVAPVTAFPAELVTRTVIERAYALPSTSMERRRRRCERRCREEQSTESEQWNQPWHLGESTG
jgi:hypothetical protein